MRCPTCEKFVSMDFPEPELDGDLDIDAESGLITGTVQLKRDCTECGETLKEATLEMETELDGEAGMLLEAHLAGHRERDAKPGVARAGELEVELDSIDSLEEGGGRYKKSYFGATVHFTVTCGCDSTFTLSGSMEDKVQASGFDEVA